MPQNPLKLAYNPALDGLRAVAILLVILSHAHAPMFDGAFFGVDLFFVLSGYLITSLLLKEIQATGRIDFWEFYRRRFYRLMPPLAVFLAAYALLAPLVWPDLEDVYSDALVSLLYLADYGIAFFDSPDTLLHMWSLSVEEHFYLVWPIALLWLVRRSTHSTRQAQPSTNRAAIARHSVPGLLLGSLLAALVLDRHPLLDRLQQHLPRLMWIPLAVPLLMAMEWGDMGPMVWGLTVVEMAALVVLVAVLPGQGLVYEMLSAPWLVYIGKLSYGIYLWHYPVVRWLRAEFAWPVTVLLGFVISTALAALSFYTIERWALRRRDAVPQGHPQTAADAGKVEAANMETAPRGR